MIAVCGIGNPSGLRNSATTAYQSARPPMVAASANAATKPNTGCTCSRLLAVMNTARVPASTSVASALTRRNSAARAASPGASNENVPDVVMAAFELREPVHMSCAYRRHLDRSNASCPGRGATHLAVRRGARTQKSAAVLLDGGPAAHHAARAARRAAFGERRLRGNARQKEGPHQAGLRMIGWSTDPKSDQAVLL